MLNNFIYAETKDLFLNELNAGNVLDEAIVFIADTKEIWNHGTYFAGDCGFDINSFTDLQTYVTNLTTSNISEGTNLYHTAARARNAITGGASTIAASNLTKNMALISNSNGKVAVSSVTSTELGYLTGVTSNIQTQLNGKASSTVETTIATHTTNKDNPHGVTKAQVGLSNVDNTADANKSVNYANTAGSAGSCTGNATTATTATNLASAPVFAKGTTSTNAITVSAGGQTSAEFTVPYATSAGSATDQTARNAAAAAQTTANGKWTYSENTIKAVKVNNAGYADSAGSVAWTGVTGRPTALSQFTNDSRFITASGSITGSSGSCTGNAATASKFLDLTLRPTDSNYTETQFNLNNINNTAVFINSTSLNANYYSAINLPIFNNVNAGEVFDFGTSSGRVQLFGGYRLYSHSSKPTGLYYRKASESTWDSWKEIMAIDSSGNICTTHTKNISTSGTFSASGGFYETSDERLKDFSESIPVDFEKLKALKKNYFTWKDSDNVDTQIGVSAQEIKEIYPEIVSQGSDGKLQVAYDKLSVVALAAIDKLEDRVKVLEEKLEMLVNKLG